MQDFIFLLGRDRLTKPDKKRLICLYCIVNGGVSQDTFNELCKAAKIGSDGQKTMSSLAKYGIELVASGTQQMPSKGTIINEQVYLPHMAKLLQVIATDGKDKDVCKLDDQNKRHSYNSPMQKNVYLLLLFCSI